MYNMNGEKTFSLNAYNCDLQVKYCLKKMIINEIYHFLCHVGDKSCILTFKVAAICLKCIVYNANGRKKQKQTRVSTVRPWKMHVIMIYEWNTVRKHDC